MTEITNIQAIMPSLNAIVGAYFWKIVFILFATIPVWVLTTTIKDWFLLKQARERLISDSILSIDGYYEINNVRGFLRVIGSRLLKLEEPDHSSHYIPIKSAVEGTISKLNYKEPVDEDNDKSRDEKVKE